MKEGYPRVDYPLSYRRVVNDPADYPVSCRRVVNDYIIAHVFCVANGQRMLLSAAPHHGVSNMNV